MNNKYLLPILFAVGAVALFAVIMLFVVFPRKQIVSEPINSTSTPAASTTTTTAENAPEIIFGVKSVLYISKNNDYKFWYPQTATISYNKVLADVTRASLAPSMFAGTNLSEAYVDVGIDAGPTEIGVNIVQSILDKCQQPRDWEKNEGVVTISGKDFSMFSGNDVGAGQLYESISYRRIENEHCYEITQVLHSSRIENYEPGAVKAFDKLYFSSILEKIAKTFQFTASDK